MIPATLLERASRRLVTVDRSARLVDAAQAFDRPETLLIIVCDEGGVIRGVVTGLLAGVPHQRYVASR